MFPSCEPSHGHGTLRLRSVKSKALYTHCLRESGDSSRGGASRAPPHEGGHVRPTCKCTPAPVTATVGCASEPTRAQHQQYDPTKEEVAAPSSNENHTLQPKKKNTAFLSPLHIPAQHASSHGLGRLHPPHGEGKPSWLPRRPPSREHESSPIFWGSHTFLKSVLCHKERPSGDPPSTSAVHTLPLSHAPRRESGAPHRFPGPAHRAAPHPRAGVLKNTCVLTSGIFEATPGTGRLMAGSPGLGSGTATAHTRLSARGGPRSPPYAALPQFSCMGKTVFFVFQDSS